MARLVLSLLLLGIAAAGASSAGLTPEIYWRTVLPNTPIPSALRQLLPTDAKPAVDQSLFGVGVAVGPSPPRVVVNVLNLFIYTYAANETQAHASADVALFFLEKNLVPGSKMTVHFAKTTPDIAFLPRSVAESLPFSSAKLSDILSRLSIDPKSDVASAIKNTLQACEVPAVKGETRFCATSLESMVDFATANLGSRNLLALSTEVSKPDSPKQAYTIAPSGVKKLTSRKAVACHAQPYAYPVYYCHATRATKSYTVSLVGKDGTRVQAVVVCHTDTSTWNPKHIAFQVLKVSPGTVPVCHFLPPDHVVMARRS